MVSVLRERVDCILYASQEDGRTVGFPEGEKEGVLHLHKLYSYMLPPIGVVFEPGLAGYRLWPLWSDIGCGFKGPQERNNSREN